jgi:hypothetical protein
MRPAIRTTRHTEPGGLRLAFRGLDHVLVRCGDSSGPSLVIRSCRRTFDQGLTSVSCHYGVLVVLDPATCISRSGPERPLPSGLPRSVDRMPGRSPGECRKGQHAPTGRKAAGDQLAADTDVPAGQKHQAVEPLGVCTSGSLTSGSKDDAEAPKATGRVGAVSRAEQG